MSTSGMNWCSIFCCCKHGKHKPWHGSLEYIPFLYGYNWTICHPFYRMPPRHWRHRLEVEYSNKDQLIPTPFAIVLVWIATKQTIGTNFKMSCLVIVTKRCHVIGAPLFPSAECKHTPWILEYSLTNQIADFTLFYQVSNGDSSWIVQYRMSE